MKKEFSKELIESIKLLYSKNYSLQKIILDLNLNCCEPTLIKCLKELGLYDSNRKGNIELIKHFIRGYFDGDGCLSYYKRVYDITPHISYVGTKDFIENSSKYLPYLHTLRVREYSKTKQNCHDLYEISINIENSKLTLDWLYKDSTIFLDRKYNRYKLFKKHNFEIPYSEEKLQEVFGI